MNTQWNRISILFATRFVILNIDIHIKEVYLTFIAHSLPRQLTSRTASNAVRV